MNTPALTLDHVLLGTPNLKAGIDALERMSGVRPLMGGQHPELGTHNALLALGERQYLELIAPRPGASLHPMLSFLDDVHGLKPVSWVMAVDDAGAHAGRLASFGLMPTQIIEGSRKTPEGAMLKWRMYYISDWGIDRLPFFIQWDDEAVHPGSSSPRGCTLATLEVRGPESEALQRIIGDLETGVSIQHAATRSIRIELDTPHGRLSL